MQPKWPRAICQHRSHKLPACGREIRDKLAACRYDKAFSFYGGLLNLTFGGRGIAALSGAKIFARTKACDMSRGMAIIMGVLVGGTLGAVARPAVVYVFCLRNAEVELSQGIMFLSAGFGFVVGILAVLIATLQRGVTASVVVGASIGGFLAYLVTAITFLPLYFAGLFGVSGLEFKEEPWLYGLAMAFAGALAGGVGALLQGRLSRPPTNPISAPRLR